jgi:hypothetical protein
MGSGFGLASSAGDILSVWSFSFPVHYLVDTGLARRRCT